MKTLTQYREDVQSLMKKVADIDAKAINECRDLNPDELQLKNDIFDEIGNLKNIIETMERQERVTASLEAPNKPLTVQKSQPTSNTNTRSQDRFNSFGEQLAAVMNAGRPGGKVDPRLYNAASGLGETVPSDGGLR